MRSPGAPLEFGHMRIRWSIAFALFAVAAAAFGADRSVTLKVDGWHSKGDAYKTESAVRAMKGVKDVSWDVEKRQLIVKFDDAVTSQAQVEKAVAAAGYSVAR